MFPEIYGVLAASAGGAASTLLDSLVAYWKLDEASGTRVDSAGVANLSENGAVPAATGKINNAADFSGISNYLSSSDTSFVFGSADDFTIAGWVKFTTKSTSGILAKGNVSGGYWIGYGAAPDRFRFSVSGVSSVVDANQLGSPSTGVWYFVVAWQDVTAGTVNIQVNNGTPDSTAVVTGLVDTGLALAIGAFSDALFPFNGIADEMGVWRRLLTSEERTALYNSGNGLSYPFGGVSGTIAITSPSDYQVFQRDGTDLADIAISGTYIGTPTAIEASWNGGAYATIDAAPAGGTFSGTLFNQGAGQGNLTVRFTNDTAVSASASFVGVGDVFIVAGQSNAEGYITNPQSYNHATLKAGMFREDGAWAELADHTDSDRDGSGNGSVWPLLATLHMAAESVPVAFVTAADGSTALVNPVANWQSGGSSYANFTNVVSASGINSAKAVLWFQGERDASNGTTQAAYQTALSAMLDSMQTDTGFASIPLVCGQIGYDGRGTSRANIDAIRQAQSDRWATDVDIDAGPLTYDIDISSHDTIHFETDAEALLLAQRWWRTIDAALFGGAEAGRGPQFSSATRSGTTVTVTFTGGQGNLQNQTDTTGWRFTDDGTPIAINSAAANGTNAVDLTLASTPTGVELISFGSGNDGARATLQDSGTYPLPPEPFVDEAVV